MPISDYEPYETGHFQRIYDYIIKPAVHLAGFQPIRADEVRNTNYIALDILKKILNSEMTLCDLSGKNPNVLYELGLRQAFNLPVTFIKDSITDRVFDIQGFRDIEYDEKLRVDNVKNNIEEIAETLKNTYESKDSNEVNSLVSLLGIEAAKTIKKEISSDTELIISQLENLGLRIGSIESQISPKNKASISLNLKDSDFDNQQVSFQRPYLKPDEIFEGLSVLHQKFGIGKVISLEGKPNSAIAKINFAQNGDLKIMLNYAKLLPA